MEQFADYTHTLTAISILVLIALVLGPFSAVKKFERGVESGALPEADYADRVYRLSRAYLNLVENMPWFLGAALAAMLAGASPVSVNWLASLFLILRIVHLVVHLRGVGKANLGLRTYAYTGASLCTGLLAVLTMYTVFIG